MWIWMCRMKISRWLNGGKEVGGGAPKVLVAVGRGMLDVCDEMRWTGAGGKIYEIELGEFLLNGV